MTVAAATATRFRDLLTVALRPGQRVDYPTDAQVTLEVVYMSVVDRSQAGADVYRCSDVTLRGLLLEGELAYNDSN